MRASLTASQEEVQREKAKLQQAVTELHVAASALAQQGDSLDKQARMLSVREKATREGQAQLKMAQMAVRKREDEVVTGMKECEARLLELNGHDRDITKRKTEVAIREREVSQKGAQVAMSSNNIILVNNTNNNTGSDSATSTSTSKNPKGKPAKSPKAGSSPTAAWQNTPTSPETDENLQDHSATGLPMSDWMKSFRGRLDEGQQATRSSDKHKAHINDELQRTRKVMQIARGTLARTTSTRVQAERMLSDETSFMATLQAQRARSKVVASDSR
jgi:hypothetical protein